MKQGSSHFNHVFSKQESQVLSNYVTNSTRSIFALKNLPEVIKGALFSRYSRSKLGLRELLLKEFIGSTEEGADFSRIVSQPTSMQEEAIQKAQKFYDRILDGYGDDSIGELGGAHLALENISMLAAKVVEDARIGGSPLEKSTRYIPFDEKVDGAYKYVREKKLMNSTHAALYEATCDMLFDTYSSLINPVMDHIKKITPKGEDVSERAYMAALKASVFDALRGLLPASTMTNMGMFGNGRFFEGLIQRLHTDSHEEMQEIGEVAQHELSKVIPSFVRRSHKEHRYQVVHRKYIAAVQSAVQACNASCVDRLRKQGSSLGEKYDFTAERSGVAATLIRSDDDAENALIAALLYESSSESFETLQQYAENMPEAEKSAFFKELCSQRATRRSKSPRALEHVFFTFAIRADYGSYRDLHRHRMLTQERRKLTCAHGYYTPKVLQDAGVEQVYIKALDQAKKAYDIISKEYPSESQYIVPMAYNVEWYFHVNLRALQWLTELRSQPQGHETYREVAHMLADAVMKKHPSFEPFFSFVDFDGYALGRLDQEVRTDKKKAQAASS